MELSLSPTIISEGNRKLYQVIPFKKYPVSILAGENSK